MLRATARANPKAQEVSGARHHRFDERHPPVCTTKGRLPALRDGDIDVRVERRATVVRIHCPERHTVHSCDEQTRWGFDGREGQPNG